MSPSAHAKEEGSQDPVPVSIGGSYTIRVSHIVLSHTYDNPFIVTPRSSGHLCWLQNLCQALEHRCVRTRRTTRRDSFYPRQSEQSISTSQWHIPWILFYS
jgi:hypothetical protein